MFKQQQHINHFAGFKRTVTDEDVYNIEDNLTNNNIADNITDNELTDDKYTFIGEDVQRVLEQVETMPNSNIERDLNPMPTPKIAQPFVRRRNSRQCRKGSLNVADFPVESKPAYDDLKFQYTEPDYDLSEHPDYQPLYNVMNQRHPVMHSPMPCVSFATDLNLSPLPPSTHSWNNSYNCTPYKNSQPIHHQQFPVQQQLPIHHQQFPIQQQLPIHHQQLPNHHQTQVYQNNHNDIPMPSMNMHFYPNFAHKPSICSKIMKFGHQMYLKFMFFISILLFGKERHSQKYHWYTDDNLSYDSNSYESSFVQPSYQSSFKQCDTRTQNDKYNLIGNSFSKFPKSCNQQQQTRKHPFCLWFQELLESK